MKSLLITKEESELTAYLDRLHGMDYGIHCTSFLEFHPVYAPIQDSFSILFFSSPRSVIFYLGQHQVPSGTLLACAGKRTAEILRAMGHRADFVGEKSGDMAEVATALKAWSGERRILFPVSSRTLGTVSKAFPEAQKEELTVYYTRLRPLRLETFTHYVFTSPSNVEGFLLENKVVENATVIAWGKSTLRALESAGIPCQITLERGTMDELMEVLA
jgi:uroporphyrinogen-III synthase